MNLVQFSILNTGTDEKLEYRYVLVACLNRDNEASKKFQKSYDWLLNI